MLSPLKQAIINAAKFLPQQAPLQSFVHHNTLHHFENLPFKEALKKAGKIFNSQSFASEDFFRSALKENRINKGDIDQVIARECENSAEKIFEKAPTIFELRKWRLNNLFEVPTIDSIDWYLYENQAFEKAHPLAANHQFSSLQLKDLWQALKPKEEEKNLNLLRLRDKIFLNFKIDIDELVNPLLIKLSAAFLDQGIAFDTMPQRIEGFLSAFRKIYKNNIFSAKWLKDLSAEIDFEEQNFLDAEKTILKNLNLIGLEEKDWEEFFTQTLLALPGWAGMFYQFETNAIRIPVNNIPAKIDEFLAVRLLLEIAAAKYVLRQVGSDFYKINNHQFIDLDYKKSLQILRYEAFICAQSFGLTAADFNKNNCKKWLKEIAAFDKFERCYYLFLAYEKQHQQRVLDALCLHEKSANENKKEIRFQAVFCMDEREESFRRHLEEICPNVETFGFAGFYGVAMQYKGLDDIRPLPLCPVVISPNIFIEEVAISDESSHKYRNNLVNIGRLKKLIIHIRQSLINSAVWSFAFGIFKIFPLIGRSLFPLQTAKILTHFHHLAATKPKTKLLLERTNEEDRKFGFKVGFSVDEMTNIIFSVLDGMDLKKDFAPLVIMVGHGSSTCNNPHESAYNCGATGGGKGSANARAFAMMANDERVRAKLKERGVTIPSSTVFIGALHDTCNDEMEYFDIDDLTKAQNEELHFIKKLFVRAAINNAKERSRHFGSVPRNISAKEAKTYIEQRSIDLAQPRPEYGHGSNAFCIIGRRKKTAGLYLDRRAFLISYNPFNDKSGDVLGNIINAALPVGAGISLEYYFSFIDPFKYGCNTKLPHNVTSLIGVMDGSCSDLRTGLPWQTVEIHEPMRLLVIIEAYEETLLEIVKARAEVKKLVMNNWVKIAAINPKSGKITILENGEFIAHKQEQQELPQYKNSGQYCFDAKKQHLNYANIIN